MTAVPLLVADRVMKAYPLRDGAVTALAAVSFQVDAGAALAVVGPSGTGKSTLASILAGWEQPTSGRVLHPGGATTVAFVPQRPVLFDTLSVAANIELAAPERSTDVADVAARLGVDHLLARFPADASLGEQQRIAVARAVHARPRLLILDEPTAHQDAATTELLVAAASAPAPDSAVVFTTHDADLAIVATHRVVLSKPPDATT